MKKTSILLSLAACVFVMGCDSETREGKLQLSGSAPLRIVDEGGKTVEFVNGPLKVELSARSGNKFSVSMEQSGRKAKFGGKVSGNSDWNFTLRGKEIGQLVDITSNRKVTLYGEPRKTIGNGGSCGMNGTYVTEETWQSCDEDWKVGFSDVQLTQFVGIFESHRKGESCLVDVRNLYCRERPDHDRPGRDRLRVKATPAAVKTLQAQVDSGIKFD